MPLVRNPERGAKCFSSSGLVLGGFFQDLNLFHPLKKNSTTQPSTAQRGLTTNESTQQFSKCGPQTAAAALSTKVFSALARSANSGMLVTPTLNKFSLERGQKKALLVHIPEST